MDIEDYLVKLRKIQLHHLKSSEVEGINWLELDVAITKDEQLIIIHDDYLERTTNMSGEITELNYDEIKDASAGSWFGEKFKDEHLPTFDDVVK